MATLDRTTIPVHDSSSARIRKFLTYTGPASYAAGGDSLTPAEVGIGKVFLILAEHATNGTVLLLLRYDYTNQKMKWFDLAGVEVVATTNLSTYSARLEVVGL